MRDDSDYSVNFVSSTLSSSSTATVTLSLQGRTLSYPSVSCGSNSQESPSINLTSTQRQCLSRLLHASCVYSHVALIGPSSSGKSEIARAYARILGYHPYTIVSAYKEMTSFDLLYVFFLFIQKHKEQEPQKANIWGTEHARTQLPSPSAKSPAADAKTVLLGE